MAKKAKYNLWRFFNGKWELIIAKCDHDKISNTISIRCLNEVFGGKHLLIRIGVNPRVSDRKKFKKFVLCGGD